MFRIVGVIEQWRFGMKPSRILFGLLIAAAVGGCTGSTGNIGTNVGFNNAEAAALALENEVIAAQLAEGVTTSAEMPISDVVTYDGYLHGYVGGGSGPDFEHYASLEMTADFGAETISGSVTNMYTDLPGFLTPLGTATVTGTLDDSVDGGDIEFTATGTFVGTDRTADYLTTADGDFIGDTTTYAFGDHTSDFDWVTGPDAGDTSFSDGEWSVQD